MKDSLRDLVEAMATLHQRVTLLEAARERDEIELRFLRHGTRAHRTLLRSLPVSAWPPMMAGEFVALWEGEDG